VLVWNRTPERARTLARDLGARAVAAPEPADLLVNCTSVGLPDATDGDASEAGPEGPARAGAGGGGGAVEEAGLERSASEDFRLNQLGLTFDQVGEYSYVVDLVYRSGYTPLLAAARAHGARTLDGLEILVAQGALSLESWTGSPAPLEVMRRAAREG
jgi:shikimate dehydrogenase